MDTFVQSFIQGDEDFQKGFYFERTTGWMYIIPLNTQLPAT